MDKKSLSNSATSDTAIIPGVQSDVLSPRRHKESAFKMLSISEIIILYALLASLLILLLYRWHTLLILLVSILTILYFLDLIFNFSIILRSSLSLSREIEISKEEMDSKKSWPMYTVLCPLYKEAHMLPQFTKAMHDLDYPKGKLQVLLILEEDDVETIEEVKRMKLPSSFEVVVVPHSLPKTKPKACNHALDYMTGTYAVIFDAEDIPEPDQLKKAVLGFEKVDDKTICLQAKLNYYNPHQNVLTKLFTLEYSLWFEVILTGLQSINGPIPLGGTSNHFRAKQLRELKGWDPFNVTEDADLGMRISKSGYKTAIINSVTMEEANSQFKNWLRQRSRWIKGYMQTYLVHMQNPFDFSLSDFAIFQLVVGGKIISALINPIMWLMTIAFFASRAEFGGFISSLYVGPMLYVGGFTLFIGNFIYAYIFMIGVAERKHWSLVKYAILAPFYWLAISVAAYYALWELIVRPHHWQKTKHGLHLKSVQVS
jgi:glycosyltransferase XagB